MFEVDAVITWVDGSNPAHKQKRDHYLNQADTPLHDNGTNPHRRVDRARLEADWLTITRQTLPALAKTRRWPVSADHCFMRILLDAVHDGRWDKVVPGRPAYKHIDAEHLVAAVKLAERVAANEADLWALNAQSLAWRGKGKTFQPPRSMEPILD